MPPNVRYSHPPPSHHPKKTLEYSSHMNLASFWQRVANSLVPSVWVGGESGGSVFFVRKPLGTQKLAIRTPLSLPLQHTDVPPFRFSCSSCDESISSPVVVPQPGQYTRLISPHRVWCMRARSSSRAHHQRAAHPLVLTASSNKILGGQQTRTKRCKKPQFSHVCYQKCSVGGLMPCGIGVVSVRQAFRKKSQDQQSTSKLCLSPLLHVHTTHDTRYCKIRTM